MNEALATPNIVDTEVNGLVGMATINGHEIGLKVIEGHLGIPDFSFVDQETGKEIVDPNLVRLIITAIHQTGWEGNKYPIYEEPQKQGTFTQLKTGILKAIGIKVEKPVIATRTILNGNDQKITDALNARDFNNVVNPIWGWSIQVNNSTPPDKLAQFGITQDQLYISDKAEEKKTSNSSTTGRVKIEDYSFLSEKKP